MRFADADRPAARHVFRSFASRHSSGVKAVDAPSSLESLGARLHVVHGSHNCFAPRIKTGYAGSANAPHRFDALCPALQVWHFFFNRPSTKIMPSHFSTIGLPVNDEDEYFDLAERAAEHSDVIEVTQGQYLRWTSECGAEMWIQLNDEDEFLGMVPHFCGESRMRVGISARVNRPDDTVLDGAFHGWADPVDDDPESGSYPLIFDSPDYQRHSDLTLPAIVSVQIAAFAHEISIFDSVDEFDASQTDEPRFASQSFIPSGMFEPDLSPTEQPQSYAMITGHVVKAAKKKNQLTGSDYYWALVESVGGSFDVVVDPELVATEPKAGSVLSGEFWLSGSLRQE